MEGISTTYCGPIELGTGNQSKILGQRGIELTGSSRDSIQIFFSTIKNEKSPLTIYYWHGHTLLTSFITFGKKAGILHWG